MADLQISMQEIINKLRERVSIDAQNIAVYEATIDAYKKKVEEMQNIINSMEKPK